MRVLVTGGAGYIGSHTVAHLRARGDEVVVIDTLEHGHPGAIPGTPLVVGDVGDAALVRRLLDEHAIEAVVHFAARKSVAESIADPAGYFGANVGGSLGLLRAMAEAGVRQLVVSSTCAVYGTPDRLPVTETTPTRPENPYGESKLMVERLLPWFERAAGIRSIALRYFNAAGAALDGSNGEDWTDAQNLVPIVMQAALGRRPVVDVFGTDYPTPDGTAIRDYVHVLDLAEAHARALELLAEGTPSLVVNVGTGRGASVHEVVAATERVTGRPVPTREAPRRVGDPAAVWADTSLARERLGWSARYDLEAILGTAWRWHSSHPDGHASAGPESAAPDNGAARASDDGPREVVAR